MISKSFLHLHGYRYRYSSSKEWCQALVQLRNHENNIPTFHSVHKSLNSTIRWYTGIRQHLKWKDLVDQRVRKQQRIFQVQFACNENYNVMKNNNFHLTSCKLTVPGTFILFVYAGQKSNYETLWKTTYKLVSNTYHLKPIELITLLSWCLGSMADLVNNLINHTYVTQYGLGLIDRNCSILSNMTCTSASLFWYNKFLLKYIC